MDVTTVIINYQTPDYLEKSVTSFKKFYANIPLLIIDNGSKDESLKVIDKLENKFEHLRSQRLNKNIFHGPAMDLAARELVHSKYIFFLDSDTETRKGGFLENMLNFFMLLSNCEQCFHATSIVVLLLLFQESCNSFEWPSLHDGLG